MRNNLSIVNHPLFWPNFWKWTLITLGVAAYIGVGFIGFNLALGQLGCNMLWNLMAGWCGSHTGMIMAACLFVAPIAFYFTIRRPWLFPVSLYALLVPSDSYLNFTQFTGGSSLTKLCAMLAVVAMLFFIVRVKRIVNPGASMLVWTGYVVWSSLTLLWAFHVEDGTITLWGTLLQLFAFYVILSISPIDEKDFRVLLNSFIIGAMFASCFGATVFGIGGARIVNEGRLKAHFDPENKLVSDLFSASFVFPVALLTMQALRTKWGLKKLGFILVWAVLLVGQLVVGSRGGLLADAMAAGYFFLKGRYRSQILFLAGLGLTVSAAFPTSTWGRFLRPDPSGGSGRVEIWKVGLAELKNCWIQGCGFSNFEPVYNKYFLTVWNQYYEHWGRAPHNILLQAAVELGIVGLILLLLGWWTTFKAMDHIPKGHPMYDFRIAMEAGVFGSFVAAIFVGVMLSKFTWFSFTIVLLWRQVTMRRIAEEKAAAAGVDPSTVHLVPGAGPPPQPLPVPEPAR
jgi:O-antigen ligase/polysaccharide polymerase Wzy-like membrane protein